MSEVNQAVEVKQEGEFSLKGKKKIPKKFSDTSNNEPIKVDLTKPEAQGEVVSDVIKVDLTEKKETDAIQESSTESLDAHEPSTDGKEVGETHAKPQDIAQEVTIQEITEE